MIALIFVALALAYGVVNPPFESPDEIYHFDYVEELLRTRRLPVLEEGELSEFHQPPLYYAIGAILTAWLPTGDPAPSVVERNPFWAWRIGDVGVDNKSQYLHGPEQAFPWKGLWLRLHLLRAYSTLLGLVVVWETAHLARLIWPQERELALLASASLAFLPQFLFLASSVSNDIATVTASILVLVVLARSFTLHDRRLRWAAIEGMLLGCTILTKMNMLIVVALVFATISRLMLHAWWVSHHGHGDRQTHSLPVSEEAGRYRGHTARQGGVGPGASGASACRHSRSVSVAQLAGLWRPNCFKPDG